MYEVDTYNTASPFDAAKRLDDSGNEFWSARDLQTMMGYTEWRNFDDAIQRAMAACRNSGYSVEENFMQVTQLGDAGNLGMQERKDYHLSRYGSYLLAMNGDPRKPEIANAQTYFAVKTREAELAPTGGLIYPQNYAEALRAHADAVERAEREALARREAEENAIALEVALDAVAPEVLAFRDCLSQINTLGLQDAARVLVPVTGMGPNQFLAKLREDGILFHGRYGANKVNFPSAEYVEHGYFRQVPGFTSEWGETQLKTRITRKGFEFIIRKYATPEALNNLQSELMREFSNAAPRRIDYLPGA
ncbi:phage antirepressor KilAC domain-containing protein [Micromonospora azadirachtae]|uniref:Phage antirepressor KilAC domain-containing protein n=1 Tax=Micromonospora azadirachtae TaxID=1970735 RepID=A0ABW2ZW22_9ACTN